MKKALVAALTGALCSLNLAGADEDIAKFEAGCNYGSGCEMLGLRYENGTYGFEVDKKKAKYFYKKACKLGAKWSCKYEQAL